MSLRASLVDDFKADSTISALVGDRVFDMFYDFEDFLNSRANRVSKFPAITIESEGAENENNLFAHDNLNRETFTITCYQQVNLSKLRSRSSSVRNKERDILRQIDALGDAVNAFIKDKRGIVDTYNIRSSHISSDTDDTFESEDNREIITRVLTYNVGWSTTVAPIIPVNTVLPLISGDTEEGSVITTINGTWSNSPTSFTYRWLRDGSPISGETSTTYTSQAADVGTAITSEVTAINGAGSSLPAVSSNSIVVTSAIPLPIQLGVEAWQDYSDASKLVEGATSVNVAGWSDSSGKGNDFSQLTPAAQFTYNLAGGYIEGDGSKFLEIASRFGLAANPDLTILVKMRDTSAGASFGLFQIGGISSGETGVLTPAIVANKVGWLHNNGNRLFGSINSGQNYVLAFRRSAASNYGASEVLIDGVASSETSVANPTNVPTSTSTEAATAHNSPTQVLSAIEGRIYEIMVFTKLLTDQEISDLGNYINTAPPVDARFIMLGDSITNNQWGDASDFIEEVATEFSKTILVTEEATGGWSTTDLKNNIDIILSNYPDPAGEPFDTYCTVHIGINNVNATRPFSTATQGEKDTITNDITYILAAITTKGYTPILSDISFCDFDDTTVASPENGVLPYNTNLIRALVPSEFKYGSGKPWLQYYDLILSDHATYLLADNVHHTAAGQDAMRNHFKDTIVNYVLTGTAPTEIV